MNKLHQNTINTTVEITKYQINTETAKSAACNDI